MAASGLELEPATTYTREDWALLPPDQNRRKLLLDVLTQPFWTFEVRKIDTRTNPTSFRFANELIDRICEEGCYSPFMNDLARYSRWNRDRFDEISDRKGVKIEPVGVWHCQKDDRGSDLFVPGYPKGKEPVSGITKYFLTAHRPMVTYAIDVYDTGFASIDPQSEWMVDQNTV